MKCIKAIGAMLLAAAVTFMSVIPAAPVFAGGGTTQGRVLRLASAGTGIKNGDHVYYGHYNPEYYYYRSPFGTGGGENIPYWRVLDTTANDDNGTPALFLLSERLWGVPKWEYAYDTTQVEVYGGITLPNNYSWKDWCDVFKQITFDISATQFSM